MTPSPSRRRAFTLVEVFIVIFIVAILAAIATPTCTLGQGRAEVSRAMADQRSMATALASYYVDHGGYPLAMAPSFDRRFASNSLRKPFARVAPGATHPDALATLNANAARLAEARVSFARSGVAWDAPGGFATLTKPIAYLTAYFRDPFSPGEALTYSYLPDGQGYLLASFGRRPLDSPDPTALSALAETMRAQFGDRAATPFDGLAIGDTKRNLRVGASPDGRAYTYDPTNGTYSEGAVYRVSD